VSPHSILVGEEVIPEIRKILFAQVGTEDGPRAKDSIHGSRRIFAFGFEPLLVECKDRSERSPRNSGFREVVDWAGHHKFTTNFYNI
jgi:hypothetical protein